MSLHRAPAARSAFGDRSALCLAIRRRLGGAHPALVSPLHEAGERSFALHMTEHELIMLVATALLAASNAGGASGVGSAATYSAIARRKLEIAAVHLVETPDRAADRDRNPGCGDVAVARAVAVRPRARQPRLACRAAPQLRYRVAAVLGRNVPSYDMEDICSPLPACSSPRWSRVRSAR